MPPRYATARLGSSIDMRCRHYPQDVRFAMLAPRRETQSDHRSNIMLGGRTQAAAAGERRFATSARVKTISVPGVWFSGEQHCGSGGGVDATFLRRRRSIKKITCAGDMDMRFVYLCCCEGLAAQYYGFAAATAFSIAATIAHARRWRARRCATRTRLGQERGRR